MKVAHIALWTSNLEEQAIFWQEFFGGIANEKYSSTNNPGFESYFIQLNEGPTIELMTKPGLEKQQQTNNRCGWAHLALSVGNQEAVDKLALIAKEKGILVGAPRLTGDGYYEAIIEDPDGNLIEIVA